MKMKTPGEGASRLSAQDRCLVESKPESERNCPDYKWNKQNFICAKISNGENGNIIDGGKGGQLQNHGAVVAIRGTSRIEWPEKGHGERPLEEGLGHDQIKQADLIAFEKRGANRVYDIRNKNNFGNNNLRNGRKFYKNRCDRGEDFMAKERVQLSNKSPKFLSSDERHFSGKCGKFNKSAQLLGQDGIDWKNGQTNKSAAKRECPNGYGSQDKIICSKLEKRSNINDGEGGQGGQCGTQGVVMAIRGAPSFKRPKEGQALKKLADFKTSGQLDKKAHIVNGAYDSLNKIEAEVKAKKDKRNENVDNFRALEILNTVDNLMVEDDMSSIKCCGEEAAQQKPKLKLIVGWPWKCPEGRPDYANGVKGKKLYNERNLEIKRKLIFYSPIELRESVEFKQCYYWNKRILGYFEANKLFYGNIILDKIDCALNNKPRYLDILRKLFVKFGLIGVEIVAKVWFDKEWFNFNMGNLLNNLIAWKSRGRIKTMIFDFPFVLRVYFKAIRKEIIIGLNVFKNDKNNQSGIGYCIPYQTVLSGIYTTLWFLKGEDDENILGQMRVNENIKNINWLEFNLRNWINGLINLSILNIGFFWAAVIENLFVKFPGGGSAEADEFVGQRNGPFVDEPMAQYARQQQQFGNKRQQQIAAHKWPTTFTSTIANQSEDTVPINEQAMATNHQQQLMTTYGKHGQAAQVNQQLAKGFKIMAQWKAQIAQCPKLCPEWQSTMSSCPLSSDDKHSSNFHWWPSNLIKSCNLEMCADKQCHRLAHWMSMPDNSSGTI